MKHLKRAGMRFGRWLMPAGLVVGTSMSILALASGRESSPPSGDAASMVSFAQSWYAKGVAQETGKPETNKKAAPAPREGSSPNCVEAEQLRKDIKRLTGEVQRLRKKVADLEKDHQVNSIQDQLTKEEQRAEGLQLRLVEIAEKEAGLQSRMDQVNQQLQPEHINATLAGVGSLRPEEVREEVRHRLTNEKQRIQLQLDLLHQERARTQSSLAISDAAIQRLRLELSESTKP